MGLTILLAGEARGESDELAGSPSSCRFCSELALQLEDGVDRATAIDLCHILAGALHQLQRRRAAFLAAPRYIDLFPLVYWHVTRIEMQRLHDREFTHPIEKMRQMLFYVDAYHRNRDRWQLADAGEPHWRRHFVAAAQTDLATGGVARGAFVQTPKLIERVLGLANSAHVEFDFPRAIRDSFARRSSATVDPLDLYSDFIKTNDTLRMATVSSSRDIFEAIERGAWWRSGLTLSAELGMWDRIIHSTSTWVIDQRAVAWGIAFGGRDLPTGNEPSPESDHEWLAAMGRAACPFNPGAPSRNPTRPRLRATGKKRRRELGLLQREAAGMMGVSTVMGELGARHDQTGEHSNHTRLCHTSTLISIRLTPWTRRPGARVG